MLVDDEDQALTERELEILFSECADDEKCIKLLGTPSDPAVAQHYSDLLNLLEIVRTENLDLEFEGELNLMMKPSDLHYGNWKKTKVHLR
jgi:hypothetical protein